MTALYNRLDMDTDNRRKRLCKAWCTAVHEMTHLDGIKDKVWKWMPEIKKTPRVTRSVDSSLKRKRKSRHRGAQCVHESADIHVSTPKAQHIKALLDLKQTSIATVTCRATRRNTPTTEAQTLAMPLQSRILILRRKRAHAPTSHPSRCHMLWPPWRHWPNVLD